MVHQGKKAKRPIDDAGYITKEWLLGCLGKSCGDCLTYSRAHGEIECDLTAQRLSNNEYHQFDAIVPYCANCNVYM